MKLDHKTYFKTSNPHILTNDQLRSPQINGYFEVYEHFIVKNKKSHAIVVLPTGVGKTGLMALLPFHISDGRVLIIAPQLVIRDTVVNELDPESPRNFWLQRGVFEEVRELPALVEYLGNDTPQEVLDKANIVVTNAQKLQKRLYSSMLHRLPSDYFDMILIDEAHHSTAKTWIDTIHHFNHAKVVKITATPFRTDQAKIVGDLVYKYKLSQAMSKGYVKSLNNVTYIPEQLYLTLDNNSEEKYTIEQIREMNLKDEEWISRSVAYSDECKQSVVDQSIQLLEKQLKGTSVPHKIIAIAPTIEEAIKVNDLYHQRGYSSVVIHNELDDAEKKRAFNDIKNHRVQIVVNVSMLGEGYDHNYLSIAAIFRAFRSPLPYAQFIGRILRVIPANEVNKPSDNIGNIIAHKHLGLEHLWEYYKREIQESEIIKELEEESEQDINEENKSSHENKDYSIGIATEEGKSTLVENAYLETELMRRHRKEEEERSRKIIALQKELKVDETTAEQILDSVQSIDSEFKRPDLLYRNKRSTIDVTIREEIIPSLLVRLGFNTKGNELLTSRIFSQRYSWIAKIPNANNGGILGTYFNTYLKNFIGLPRDEWSIRDLDIAFDELEIVREYVENILLEEFDEKGGFSDEDD